MSSILDPTTWSLESVLGIPRGSNKGGPILGRLSAVSLIYGSVIFLVWFWLSQVTRYVPAPYLDEFFHIPQAQSYCRGDIWSWDPKITTPPGLYGISAIIIRFLKGGVCTTLELRATSSIALVVLLYSASQCRHLIQQVQVYPPSSTKSTPSTLSQSSWDTIHTAVNICLFPPLFFFSGLYYTDVLSTCVVIAAYNQFLRRGQKNNQFITGLSMYGWGIFALLMRQTNIFWVAIYFAGLEWIRTCKESSQGSSMQNPSGVNSSLVEKIKSFSSGQLHDPLLSEADVLDYFWCILSIGVSAVSSPLVLISRIWPYIGLLSSFAAFVLWNGGVVLGDKSNHVATIHLPQMLYIWPFMAFFSAPLIIPSVVNVLTWTFSLLNISNTRYQTKKFDSKFQLVQYFLLAVLALFISTVIIRYNTIIHPFTLADNRHYVFYVFRYTIRRHPLIRYLLAPMYLLSGFFILRCLSVLSTSSISDPTSTAFSSTVTTPPRAGRQSHPNRRQSTLADSFTGSDKKKQPISKNIYTGEVAEIDRQQGVRISFLLIWLLSTALPLITAPLVEPRYFIIPWVMWRLHVPSLLPPSSSTLSPAASSNSNSQGGRKKNPNRARLRISLPLLMETTQDCVYRKHDYRLWIETAWYLLINAVTGYVFLFRGFEWPQEPGKVQRFLW